MSLQLPVKQKMLEVADVQKRLQALLEEIQREVDILNVDKRIRGHVIYDQRVADLSDAVPAGTGKCGTPSTSKNSIVCFLKTEDGLVQATADSTKVTQEEIVSFANELTTLLGTA